MQDMYSKKAISWAFNAAEIIIPPRTGDQDDYYDLLAETIREKQHNNLVIISDANDFITKEVALMLYDLTRLGYPYKTAYQLAIVYYADPIVLPKDIPSKSIDIIDSDGEIRPDAATNHLLVWCEQVLATDFLTSHKRAKERIKVPGLTGTIVDGGVKFANKLEATVSSVTLENGCRIQYILIPDDHTAIALEKDLRLQLERVLQRIASNNYSQGIEEFIQTIVQFSNSLRTFANEIADNIIQSGFDPKQTAITFLFDSIVEKYLQARANREYVRRQHESLISEIIIRYALNEATMVEHVDNYPERIAIYYMISIQLFTLAEAKLKKREVMGAKQATEIMARVHKIINMVDNKRIDIVGTFAEIRTSNNSISDSLDLLILLLEGEES